MDQVKSAFNRAKIGLMSKANSTFITTVLFSLKHQWDKSIPTAGTDGLNLIMNPDFFMGLNKDEQIFLLAHEAWHVAFQHMFRLMGRDHAIFNQACDHVINNMLVSNGFSMPDGGLCDRNYKDMSAEQVYDYLVKNPEKQQNKPELMDIQIPGAGDSGSPDQTKVDQAKQAVEDVLIKARIQSEQSSDVPGTIPNDISIALDRLLHPKLPWHVILANYVTAISKDDFSFRRPNRRFMPDYYLPSLYSEKVGHIAVAVDTSGSVSDKEFLSFITEINHIKTRLNPELITVIDFDTTIKKVHKLHESDDVTKLEFSGRGGTNLYPVFEYFNKNKPMVLIVFSDLHCKKILEDPKYPVVWICVNNKRGSVNFGKLIHMEI